MRKKSHLILAGALALVMLMAACAPQQEGTPTIVGTLPVVTTDTPSLETGTLPAGTETLITDTTPTVDLTGTLPSTATTQTPEIPITGVDNILLECQFCIDNMAHTFLVFPDTATFELVSPEATVTEPGFETGCNAIDVFNGRQVVLCRAEENTSMTLNICADASNCTELQVDLQSCPDVAGPQPGATATVQVTIVPDTPSAGSTTTPSVDSTATPMLTIPTVTP